MSPGVESPLPRVVPDSGATLGGRFVPGGVSLRSLSMCLLTVRPLLV